MQYFSRIPLTDQFHLIDKSQKMLNQQPSILKDPFPYGQNTTSSDPKFVWGTHNASSFDQSYINMVQYHALLQTKARN